MQGRDRYCDALAGSTISVMNTSTNTNRVHDVTVIGFLRHCLAGALLAIGFVATGFGFAATAHPATTPHRFRTSRFLRQR